MVSKNQRLLSVKELAEALGVCVHTIRRAYWKGQIPGFKICKVFRFDYDRVRQVLETQGLSNAVRAGAVRVGGSRPRGQSKRPRRGNTGARIAAPKR